MKSFGYISIFYEGREVLIPERHESLALLDKEPTFCFVQRYSEAERAARREHNTDLVEELLSNSWAAEKDARRAEYEALKRTLGKKKKAPKRKYDIPDKEAWKKHHREQCRARVEAEFPPFRADDVKCPLESAVCREVWHAALCNGVSEETVDEFFSLLLDCSKVNEEAASLLFKVIARDATRLLDCFKESYVSGCNVTIKKKWLRDFMKVDIRSNGSSRGKGELGSLLLFSGLRLDPKGDLMTKQGARIEMKSISKVTKEIRLGSVKTYSDGETFKKLSENEKLRKTQLMKWISWPLINSHGDELIKVFGSKNNVKECLDNDIKTAIKESQTAFLIYDEEKEIVKELDVECVSWRSVSKEGRWKFEEKPNKAA